MMNENEILAMAVETVFDSLKDLPNIEISKDIELSDGAKKLSGKEFIREECKMSFKENYREYKKKTDTWFDNHNCSEDECPLYKYHAYSGTTCNVEACELIALSYINEVSDTIEGWYEDFKDEHKPKNKFYKMIGISLLDEKPWKKYCLDNNCSYSKCIRDLPCDTCTWWEEGFIE